MGRVVVDISTSLDGYVAGPNQSLDDPLGEGGDQLHEWAFALRAFREPHGMSGGETGPVNDLLEEGIQATGATIMGRHMYSGGQGPWEDDPNADGWWGDNPPFHHPVFVLTHHARERLAKEGGTSFTFVTAGIASALEQARDAAGDKDVAIGGGAEAIQQFLRAGLVDVLQIHVVPVLLGGGARLLERVGPDDVELETTSVMESAGVAHLRYKVGAIGR
ncbi:MAG TPA: dihydrofolate reductase family protein [Solirubrobacterales bacterium]|nr:dihydrofolate reductase family protein [Solirubrobacterales bacterium]